MFSASFKGGFYGIISVMSRPSFWYFWYLDAPRQIWRYFQILYLKLLDLFSVKIVLRTFFEPWKRDVIVARHAPLKVRMYAWAMNQVSRAVGMTLRTGVLLAFGGSILLWGWVLVSVFCFWLCFPVLFLFLVVSGAFFVIVGLKGAL